MREYGLGPLVNGSSRVLILGSFPGPTALRKREYYAHSQNRFWNTIARIAGRESAPKGYAGRKALLNSARIALWDVVASCERRGADDVNIKKESPNDIVELLSRYSKIRAVFFNGRTAERLFKKHFCLKLDARCLPSTSPANASIPDAVKLKAWKSAIKRK